MKEQSAQIVQGKVMEICKLIPALEHEIIWDTRGTKARTSQTKDSVIYTFKSGSTLENVAASEKTRGRRFQSGLLEECVSLDQTILNEVLIPTMNVSRMINGEIDPEEPLNKSQIFITSAGYKNSFAYDKQIQFLCQMVAKPQESFIMGGSWRVPVIEGLLDKDFVSTLRMDGTFNEASFDREYESSWVGDIESAFFESAIFDKYRQLNLPEYRASGRASKSAYYVMGVDVGRKGCTTEVAIIKVTPTPHGGWCKQLVNMYTFDEEHFGFQTIKLKRLFQQYKCRCAVIDANGLGAGLVDFLTMDTTDPDSGEILYNWGVVNDEDNTYRNMRTADTIYNAMYIMKANQNLNSEMYSYCQSQLRNGKMRFLIDENIAKNKLLQTEKGKKMKPEQRAEYLMPYTQTSILKDQMANLVDEGGGANIILKQNNRKIKKDKFSALIYGLYYCKLEEDKRGRRKSRDLSKLMLFG